MNYIESPDLLREQLWSPVQNTAVWLAWWLHDVIGADHVIDAFHAVQGSHHRVVFADAVAQSAPEILPDQPIEGLVGLMAKAREVTEGAPIGLEERPLVSLVLAGPGDVPLLPAGTSAAENVTRVGSGIVISDADPSRTHIVVPEVLAEQVLWTWHVVDQPLPPLPYFGPGEADDMLRQAVEQSTLLIEGSGHVAGLASGNVRNAANAHLAVGSLTDAFGLPGLPSGVSTRSERLMARADTVAAIIEVAKRSAVGANLDPQLLPMLRAVRIARMVAVDYAQRELVR